LYLVDPDGVLYGICTVPGNAYGYQFPEPAAWGEPFNTDHVILSRIIDNARSSLLEIDLRTGAQRAITVLGHWSTAEFVDAAGTSILLNGVTKMVTVNASTGEIEARFAGTDFYGALISADRTRVVSGSMTTLSVLDVRTGRIVRKLASPAGYFGCAVQSWLPGAQRFVARCFQRNAKPDAMLTFDFSLDGTTSPVRPAVPAGWDEVDLAGGKIAVKTGQPNFFRMDGMSFARLSSTGQLAPIPTPEEFKGSVWQLFGVTPAGFILEYGTPDGFTGEIALWNPITGQVKELFRKVDGGGPHGLWAGWRTTWP
jgi:hypothetical protein